LRPIHRLEQVGLLGLGRQARGGAAALDVDDDNGSSRLTASPIVSALRARPGPLVLVTPRAPPKLAPSAMPTPAISSSAWMVMTPKRFRPESVCRMSDAGVIG
jgi:hypothetical protein